MLSKISIGRRARALRLAGVAIGATLVAGCTYGGYGSYGSGYASSNYGCDPWSAYDSYYGCDSSYGFSNIGYGGGWYGDYYYPGYGQYIFDRAGTRSYMNDSYRRYWGQKRYEYQRNHNGRNDWNRGNSGNWNDRDRNNGNRDRNNGNWNRGNRGDRDRKDGNWNRKDNDRNGSWNRGRDTRSSNNQGGGGIRSRVLRERRD